MSKPKLTPWYPMATEPENEGVYEIKDPSGGRRYSLWVDGEWQRTRGSVKEAAVQSGRSTACYQRSGKYAMAVGWRGLAAQGAKT